jgi:hypothetical protein
MGFNEEQFYPVGKNNEELMYSPQVDENGNFKKIPRGRRGQVQDAPWSTIGEFELVAGQYYSDLLKVLVDKQRDYGPKNISEAPGGPINGLLVRMNDKIQRLINLTYNSAGDDPTNEAIKDSYADLANYCVIAMMVLDNKWNGTNNA